MWCSRCQQDVPGVATQGDTGFCCARCSQVLSRAPGESLTGPTQTRRRLDRWQLDEELLDAASLIRRFELSGSEAGRTFRLDPPHIDPHARAPAVVKPRRRTLSWWLAWISLTIGVTACACGGALLMGSVWGGRPHLFPTGIAFTLGGEAALVLGLLMQLDSLWRGNRDLHQSLQAVQERLAGSSAPAPCYGRAQAGREQGLTEAGGGPSCCSELFERRLEDVLREVGRTS